MKRATRSARLQRELDVTILHRTDGRDMPPGCADGVRHSCGDVEEMCWNRIDYLGAGALSVARNRSQRFVA